MLCLISLVLALSACNGGEAQATTAVQTTPQEPTGGETTPQETTPPPVIDNDLRIMTLNLLVGISSGDRADRLIAYLLDASPDVFGVQEMHTTWNSRFMRNKELRERYTSVGEYGEGGKKGMRCAIFYKTDKFELIETGTKWLTPTPDEVGKIDGSVDYRIATYAILKHKETGFTYVHINTHLDTKSGEIRKAQVNHLFDAMPDFGELPVVFTGDFNGAIDSAAYNLITQSYGFDNSARVACKGDKYTKPTSDYGTIDFIFIKNYGFVVKEYHVYTESSISDHYPVYIDILIPQK
ncbi:MAG: endonuclease/exonuclease/phosphatase family protein [Clostridia bacterium]|nr:endonuclease/exonuclease/phosphatase family protein [Clostridia bacterium]